MISKCVSLFWKLLIPFMNNKQYVKYLQRSGAYIGDGCYIHKSVSFGEEACLIHIGKNTRLTGGVKVIAHDGGLWTLRKMGLLPDADFFAPVYIGDNVHVGNNAVVMPGVTIGNNCVIGVGAIVTKNIPDNSIAVGIPARVIETIEEYYEKKKNMCVCTKHMSDSEKKQYLEKRFSK